MYSKDTILKYLDGALSPKARHEFEKAMLDDPFLNDAVEGLSEIGSSEERSIMLDQLLFRPGSGKSSNTRIVWMSAAAIILLLIVSIFTLRQFDLGKGETIAENIPEAKETIETEAATEPDVAQTYEEEQDPSAGDMTDQSQEEVMVEEDREIRDSQVTDPAPTDLDTDEITEAEHELPVVDEESRLPAENEIDAQTFEDAEDVENLTLAGAGETAADQPVTEPSQENYVINDFDSSVRVADNEQLDVVTALQAAETDDARKKSRAEDSAKGAERSAPAEARMTTTNSGAPAIGFDAFDDYIKNNLTYPEAAKNNNISGTVTLRFDVAQNGKATNIEVLSGPGSGCNEEAVRLIQEGPDWMPAGSTVTYEIEFKLE